MQYGYFDDKNLEYVITRPDTPAPWANYLGSPEYGALISNNAGGYSFVKSGAEGRILRYVFNQFDQPGRYLYIRDNQDGDYWSASWQPVGKDLGEYQSECRHGTGYTTICRVTPSLQATATMSRTRSICNTPSSSPERSMMTAGSASRSTEIWMPWQMTKMWMTRP